MVHIAVAFGYNVLRASEKANRQLELCLQAVRSSRQPWLLGGAHFYLGDAAMRRGDLAQAREHWHEAAVAWERLDPRHPNRVLAQARLGRLAIEQGDHTTARAHFSAALEHSRTLGYAPFIAHALAHLGRIDAAENDYQSALFHHRQALETNRESGNRLGTVRSLLHCAEALHALDDAPQAYASSREAAALALDAGMVDLAQRALLTLHTLLDKDPPAAGAPMDELRAWLATLPTKLPDVAPEQPRRLQPRATKNENHRDRNH
jgi:tetratricopeptide (TPR) repeat protein